MAGGGTGAGQNMVVVSARPGTNGGMWCGDHLPPGTVPSRGTQDGTDEGNRRQEQNYDDVSAQSENRVGILNRVC